MNLKSNRGKADLKKRTENGKTEKAGGKPSKEKK